MASVRLWNELLVWMSTTGDMFGGLYISRSVRLVPHISLAALLCTAFRRLVEVSEAESHEAEAYSRTGRTSCLQAVDFTCSDVVRMLRLTKPRLKCPLAAVLMMIYMRIPVYL